MKSSIMKFIATSAMLLTIMISVSAKSADDLSKVAEEAYIFAYPMLYNYQTLYTQTQDSTFPGFIGGFNRYRHYARPATPADTDIVTPNNDTTYSWAWLDLRREPIVFETPQLDKDRYNVFQWVDLYTYIFASPGARLNGMKPGKYLFVGPHWQGNIPAGFDEVFRAESDFIGTLTRTSIGDADDIPKVRTIQQGYRFTPLSEYTATKPPAPVAQVAFPAWHESLAKTPAFITYVNFLLDHIKPHSDDAKAMKLFAAIGIGAGKPFNPSALDKDTAAKIQAGIDAALAKLTTRTASNEDNIGLFGPREYLKDDYESRAVGAMIGLYGQNESEAVYFSYQKDSQGKPLDGNKIYQLKFEQAPPVSLFWSLTMYNLPQRLLVDNSIDRYSIGDRTKGLITNNDGSITITLSSKNPGKDKNWLPTPKGPFFMVMRMYGPEESILNKTWPRPVPTLVK
ncbi:hypothetical protein TW81_06610 [Vibrio galatheae]|uniref:DUF1254 domain-containing protein n=1 Tax=Vibrio galatheae TaxID=579748 RepID=A0A0F4NLD3_9VIBR|nr:DUF1254 domain-containing protein [Vibrio galatheae]KJY83990.1 hypothetical protein TW81_06610 [Vibrio galatheae]